MKNLDKKNLIFVQLNEINFDQLKKYSENYKFKFFGNNFFERLVNTESEKKYELLEPWIQWVSIYTGLEAEEHDVFRLGDFEGKNLTQIYNLIEKKGYSIGAICPMNLNNSLKKPIYFIPDPWSKSNSDDKWVNKLITNTLKKFVNENSSKNKTIIDYMKLFFIFIFYFRFKHLNLLFKLVINLGNHWNKALLFEFIINNIHLKKLNKYNPNFSSIFFNSGAHIQHHYYFNSKYVDKIKNPEWYIKNKYDPIFEMFKFYDELLSEYQNNKKYNLIIATGLRQVPYDRVKYYYRLKNHNNFLELISIKFKNVIPKMSRDFIVYFENLEYMENAFKIFENINFLNKKEIFKIDKRENSIFVTLVINEEINESTQILIEEGKKINFKKYVNFIALKNGMHDQKGYYYSNFNNSVLKEKMHVKDIFKILENYF